MIHQCPDFCFEEKFWQAIQRTGQSSLDVVTPEELACISHRKITSIKLKSIPDMHCAGDGTIIYLEIETDP